MEYLPLIDDDVLTEILPHLPRHDIYQWSLTSRRLASLTLPLPWRRVKFEFQIRTTSSPIFATRPLGNSRWDQKPWNERYELERFAKLKRTLAQSTQIGSMVQVYSLLDI
jgi:hypothetical protein